MTAPIKLVGLTQGKNEPSSRFRWGQYVEDLEQGGFIVKELESKFGAYAPTSKIYRPAWLIGGLAESALRVILARNYDVIFLQRNLIATLCTWEPLLKKPFVFDVDDAIHIGTRGSSSDRIAKEASLVICGNNFLANHYSEFANVVVLPTAVDAVRFAPLVKNNCAPRPVIGWSGSSSGYSYLYSIEAAIKEVLNRHPDAIFKVVSDKPPTFKFLPSNRVVFEKWSVNREVNVLQEFTVGIMPLTDDLWARGKCSFKMLTYMAVGLPVVVSPVGMNAEVLLESNCGYGPKDHNEWIDALSDLLSNLTLASEMGATGRLLIEEKYSKEVIAPRLLQTLSQIT